MTVEERKREIIVENYLKKMHIRTTLCGFMYLKEAIMVYSPGDKMKEIAERVSQKNNHKMTPCAVKKGIDIAMRDIGRSRGSKDFIINAYMAIKEEETRCLK